MLSTPKLNIHKKKPSDFTRFLFKIEVGLQAAMAANEFQNTDSFAGSVTAR